MTMERVSVFALLVWGFLVYAQAQGRQWHSSISVVGRNRRVNRISSLTRQRRNLQSEEEICDDILLNDFHFSDTLLAEEPCSCSRNGDTLNFDIECNYDYCEVCSDLMGFDLCGIQFSEHEYSSDGSQVLTENLCIEHTSGRDDTLCVDFVYGEAAADPPFTCSVTVEGEGSCTSCMASICSEALSEISIDCGNFASGPVIDFCSYDPTAIALDTPFVSFRTDVLEFSTCYGLSEPPSLAPTATPTSTPTSSASPVTPPSSNPTSSPTKECLALAAECTAGDTCCGANTFCGGVCRRRIPPERGDKDATKLSNNARSRGTITRRRLKGSK